MRFATKSIVVEFSHIITIHLDNTQTYILRYAKYLKKCILMLQPLVIE